MEQQLFKQEFNRMFAWFTNESTLPGAVTLEMDIHKKRWNFFLAGDSYYFVLNHYSLQCDFVSSEVEAMHGCKPSEFDLVSMSEQIHPYDLPYFLAIGRSIQVFLLQLPF